MQYTSSIKLPNRRVVISLILLTLTISACAKQAEQGHEQAPQPKRTAEWNNEPLGETLFNERCRDCHKINGKGGDAGPELSKIGADCDSAYLEQVIREPSRVYPGTAMPSGKTLTARQISSLADFLSSQQ